MKSTVRTARRTTRLVRLPGTAQGKVPGAIVEPASSPRELIWITLRLRPKSKDLLTCVQDVIEGRRRPYSYAEFTDRFGISTSDREVVTSWARKQRVRVLGINPARRTVVLRGTAKKLGALFGVTRIRYRVDGQVFASRVGSIFVPAELASIVTGVLGFDAMPVASRTRSAPEDVIAPGPKRPPGFTPMEIAQHYRFPEAQAGRGETVGVIALGGGYLKRDITAYFKAIKVKKPRISDVGVHGATNNPSREEQGTDGENTGDLQTLGALAPGAHIVVYFAPNTEHGFMAGVARAIHDQRHKPSVLSVSWGRNENHWTRRTLREFNIILAEAALLGITVCCSSGDFGAFADPRDRTPAVCFPGSSPYVLACGGTSLERLASGRFKETPWTNARGASGGGISRLFDRPAWQEHGFVKREAGRKPGRGVPDVASNADPLTGYRVFFHGKWYVGAGTSAAAPLWAGLLVRLNELHGRRVGLIAPRLYRLHEKLVRRGALRPIQPAKPESVGWNRHTGLGVPHGEKLARALRSSHGAPAQGSRRRRTRL